MALESTGRGFNENVELAVRCRDCIAGEDALKAKTTFYLPGLEGSRQDRDVKDAYASYLKRAMYYNTVARTKNFLKGLVTRNPVKPDVPKGMTDFMKDVTGNGVNFYNFSTFALDEVLSVGWGAILVDHDSVPDQVKTKKEAKENGYRIKMTWYPSESIFNTDSSIRLYQIETRSITEFDIIEEEKILVLDLDQEGNYRQRKYKKNNDKKINKKTKEEWVLENTKYPTKNGVKLKFIPFYPCGADSNSLEINKPPLLDLANVSLHHYGVYADYRNGIHFTGFPQLYVAGHRDDKTKLRMGSGVAWEFEDANASAKYAEFTGKGLEHPEKLLNRLEDHMGKLGARMLMQEKKTAESADKVRQDNTSESSLLAGIANNVSDCLSLALTAVKDWMDIEGEDIIVTLNTDYDSKKIDPALLIALMKGVQSNLITHETFLFNMKKGEILPPDITEAEELKKLVALKKEIDDKMKNNPLSERNIDGLKNPSDEIRDGTREKTDYSIEDATS